MKRWFKRYGLTASSAGYGAAMALVLALLLLASGVTPAAAQLEPPHQFYGNVYVGAGSSPAAAGTRVSARVNNVEQAFTTVDSAGRYGYSPVFKVPGSTGTVTFYIGTTKAVQEVAWQSGGINRDDGQPLHLSDTAIALTITTTSLTAGQVGTFYTRTLGVSGGTAPYTWSVSTGSPPTGLSLTGNVISGTPTVAETATFTVQVTDAVMATDTQILSITIGTSAPPPPPPGGGKLIGAASDDSGSNDHNLNMLCLTRFAADANGNITEIRVKARVAGNLKAAIYDDSSGEPGALRNASASMASAVGWNTIPITSTTVNSGTYYWLAVKMDTIGGAIYNNTSGTMRYKIPVTYADDFPNTAGTGFTSGTFHGLVAGWGGTEALVAPAAPTRDCSALTFKWNLATGATKYLLQVNTNSGFTGTDMFNAEVGNVLYREVTGLTAGTTYYWRVKAGNSAGWSDWSTPTGNTTCN